MRFSFRKLINDIHLWLGLVSGIILFIVCLTGTIYTFRTEIDEFFNKEKYFFTRSASNEIMNADSLVAKISCQQKGTVNAITIPANNNKAWTFSLKPQKSAKGKETERAKQVLVNPYTAEVTGSTESATGSFFLTIMKLHRWLLMEQPTGRIIVGVATIIFTILLLSGIILWLPKRLRYWKQAFTIMFSGKGKRLNHDLHNVLGFYAFLIMLIMALTGLCWSFEWYKNGMSKILDAPVLQRGGGKPQKSKIIEGANTMAIAKVLAAGNNTLTQHGSVRISFPEDSSGIYSFTKNNNAAFNITGTDKVSVDQYSGEVIKVEKFADKTLGQKIAASIKPIHTGEIFGLWSKIIYFICCLIATSLPVTGTIIWLNKMKKK